MELVPLLYCSMRSRTYLLFHLHFLLTSAPHWVSAWGLSWRDLRDMERLWSGQGRWVGVEGGERWRMVATVPLFLLHILPGIWNKTKTESSWSDDLCVNIPVSKQRHSISPQVAWRHLWGTKRPLEPPPLTPSLTQWFLLAQMQASFLIRGRKNRSVEGKARKS